MTAILNCVNMWRGRICRDLLRDSTDASATIDYNTYCAVLFVQKMLPLPNLYDYFLRADADKNIELAAKIMAAHFLEIVYLVNNTKSEHKYNLIGESAFWQRVHDIGISAY